MHLIGRLAHWIRTHPWAVAVLILGALQVVSLEIDRRQSHDQLEARQEAEYDQALARVEATVDETRVDCNIDNASRAHVREIGVNLSVANAEALISSASPDADPAVVAAYREHVRSNAEATVAVLAPRDCEAEVEEARRQAIEIEFPNE